MNHIRVLCLFALLHCGCLKNTLKASETSMEYWAVHFADTRDYQLLPHFWNLAVSRGAFYSGNETSMMMIGFFSRLFHERPGLSVGLLKNVSEYQQEDRPWIRLLLWYTNTKESLEILGRDPAGTRLASTPMEGEIENFPLTYKHDCFLLEGWFFATADTRALEPLFRALKDRRNDRIQIYEEARLVLLDIVKNDLRARDALRQLAVERSNEPEIQAAVFAILAASSSK